jgi:hypothetical protein
MSGVLVDVIGCAAGSSAIVRAATTNGTAPRLELFQLIMDPSLRATVRHESNDRATGTSKGLPPFCHGWPGKRRMSLPTR